MTSPKFTQKIIDRFWRKVVCSTEPNGCWTWIGSKNRYGYGLLRIDGKSCRAHRFSYELASGAIPDKLFVCHACDNPSCVNPAHLWTGTNQDNMRDCARKGRILQQAHPERTARGDRNGMRTHPEKHVRGEQAACAKLTDDKAREIRRRYAAGGIFQVELGKVFGVHRTVIGKIVRREMWKHVE